MMQALPPCVQASRPTHQVPRRTSNVPHTVFWYVLYCLTDWVQPALCLCCATAGVPSDTISPIFRACHGWRYASALPHRRPHRSHHHDPCRVVPVVWLTYLQG